MDNKKGNKKRRAKSPILNITFPELITKETPKEDEPKFILIKALTEGKTMRDINAFKLKASIDDISRQYTQASFLNDGSLLLLCNNANIANKFVNKKTLLGNTPINVSLHNNLNRTKGLVYSSSLINITEQEIVEGLKDQGVVEAYKYKNREDRTKPSGLVCLSFDRYKLPKKIHVGFELVEVREYIPNPMRCKKCQQIGHTTKFCKAVNEICAICGETLPHDTPESQEAHKIIFCINCSSGTHSSNSNECPKYLEAKEILKIQIQNKLSRFEARKKYFENKPQSSIRTKNISYAQKIINGPTPSPIPPTTSLSTKQISSPPITPITTANNNHTTTLPSNHKQPKTTTKPPTTPPKSKPNTPNQPSNTLNITPNSYSTIKDTFQNEYIKTLKNTKTNKTQTNTTILQTNNQNSTQTTSNSTNNTTTQTKTHLIEDVDNTMDSY